MSKVKSLIIFITGAAIGSAVTWYYSKARYEMQMQEEIESIKEVFGRGLKKKRTDNNSCDVLDTEDDDYEPLTPEDCIITEEQVEYERLLQKNKYGIEYSKIEKDDNKDEIDKPYIIKPEEFGEFEDYEKVTLYYYSDGVLVDEENELIENLDEVVGYDSLDTFGQYEDDAVHVRNDRIQCDFEILKDLREYKDTVKPHL